MKRHDWLFTILPLVLMISACSGQPVVTNTPLPTTSLLPSATATATFTPTPTLLPRATPLFSTADPANLPQEFTRYMSNQSYPVANLAFLSSGPDSSVVSPLQISAYVFPTTDQKIVLRLWGQDGRLMVEQYFTLDNSNGTYFTSSLPFEPAVDGEPAFLTLSSLDETGHITHLSSLPLTLLSSGSPQFTSMGFAGQAFYLTSPVVSVVGGGTLHLAGNAHPVGTSPLIIVVTDQYGQSLASKQIRLDALASGAEYVPFSVNLPYHVVQDTPVIVTLSQFSDTYFNQTASLSTFQLTLKP